jgi:CRISPR-associated endonuclease/helicase Cas3
MHEFPVAPMTTVPFAHSPGFGGTWEPLKDHLLLVSELAASHAQQFGAADEARLAALCHDLGKVGAPFQQVLRGQRRGVDHWSFGAHVIWKQRQADGRAALLAVLGHHMGIPAANRESIRSWLPPAILHSHPRELSLSPPTFDPIQQHLASAGVSLAPAPSASWVPNKMFRDEPARAMLRTRFLFSALVDADFIATEKHFLGPGSRTQAPPLEPEKLWTAFESLLQEARQTSCSNAVRSIREEVLESCLHAAESGGSLLTLTAPTGSGKTLAMLAFALRRAIRNRHRRIILVLPYLTLIQEVLSIYTRLLEAAYPDDPPDLRLIEDHSLASATSADEDESVAEDPARRRLVENWEAPIILTTNVQFFESLHSNRPARCRKLHNIANSVILLDEVQTLPRRLAPVTLASLSSLASDMRCSVLLATATQPAFQAFHQTVTQYYSSTGWSPTEIIREPARLFAGLRRIQTSWALLQENWSVDQLVQAIMQHPRVLCILNLKRQAREVYFALSVRDPEALFLSTQLCPAHRHHVLNLVKQCPHQACLRLVSTQCVEAGVDLDFPAVFRAFGPLEALAQAAGRCNRNGKLPTGSFVVFQLPPEGLGTYPDIAYAQAAQVAQVLLNEHGNKLDLLSPETFRKYYERLFSLHNDRSREDPLTESIQALDFPRVAQEYRLIPSAQVNVLVPYDSGVFHRLRQEVLQSGLTAGWVRRARPHSVAIFRPPAEAPVWSSLESVPIRPNGESGDWFILRDPDLYHPVVGFTLPSTFSFLEY